MENNLLTLPYWFCHGWRTYRNNLKKILIAAAVFSICGWFSWWLAYLPHGILVSRAFWIVVGPALFAGYSFFCLVLTRGKQATPRDFLAGLSRFGKVWLTNFLLMLIVLVGFALLIVPGIIWGLKYGFGVIIILDKELSPLRAIKLSGEITQGYKTNLFVLFIPGLILVGLNFLLSPIMQNQAVSWADPIRVIGLTFHMISNFVIVPWLSVAWATAYDALSRRYEEPGR